MAEVSFCGETFTIPDKIGAMPLMRFASLARAGVDTDDLEGLAAMYDLLRSCIAEDDWDRFETLAETEKAEGSDLWLLVQQVFVVHAERPTGQPSDSSDGPSTTSQSSTDIEFDKVKRRFEDEGRVSWALLALQAQEQKTALVG